MSQKDRQKAEAESVAAQRAGYVAALKDELEQAKAAGKDARVEAITAELKRVTAKPAARSAQPKSVTADTQA